MSLSKEHYQARLAALRKAYKSLRGVHQRMTDSVVSYYPNDDQLKHWGRIEGIEISASWILDQIQDVQYRLRNICNVRTRRDRLYRTR